MSCLTVVYNELFDITFVVSCYNLSCIELVRHLPPFQLGKQGSNSLWIKFNLSLNFIFSIKKALKDNKNPTVLHLVIDNLIKDNFFKNKEKYFTVII